ncbi:sensor histidine kinase [Streptomyces sp. NBC_01451]|uniref:sensor histidine kinase n=1 Tax=Streptomyces sp. NBC_01451 TaxID=2903872 RepID=UPI002E2F21F2|nr:histidine kinase [Streptomyces sp. NBC_01451]
MMERGDSFPAEMHRAAGLVEAHSHEILALYEEELRAARHVIASDPVTIRQALAHAEQVLADIVTSLRAGQVQVDGCHGVLARTIGASRAASGIHPRESLMAASFLYGAILSTVSRLLTAFTDPLGVFSAIALTLERSISMRVREAMGSYTAFLLDKMQDVQLEERRRIARDLHDRIGHGISVAYRNMELFGLYQESDPVKAAARVECAENAIRETMQNLRAVTSDLHSKEMLKNLEKALLHYLESADCEGVDVRLQSSGDERWAQPEVLDEVFLMIREASHNALRHAGASVLLINVTITPLELRASVEDDGCGFDPRQCSVSGGVGLFSMRERARLLKGRMLVNSRLGLGTQVEFLIPLEKAAPAS